MARNILPFRVSQQDPRHSPLYHTGREKHSFLQSRDRGKKLQVCCFSTDMRFKLELNEIQENWHMDNTLFSYMINAWGFIVVNHMMAQVTKIRTVGKNLVGTVLPLVPYGYGATDPNVVLSFYTAQFDSRIDWRYKQQLT